MTRDVGEFTSRQLGHLVEEWGCPNDAAMAQWIELALCSVFHQNDLPQDVDSVCGVIRFCCEFCETRVQVFCKIIYIFPSHFLAINDNLNLLRLSFHKFGSHKPSNRNLAMSLLKK